LDGHVNLLLKKISFGDMQALGELYLALKEGVYCLALSILRDTGGAEDVLQDTFVRAFRLASTHRPAGDGRAWIFTIAKNLCLDTLRAAGRAPVPLDDDSGETDEAGLNFIEDLEVRESLAGLDGTTRRIVLLHLAGGLKFREIALLLGMKQDTAEWKYYSALRRLSAEYYGGGHT